MSPGNLGDRTVYIRVRERSDDPFPFARGSFLHRPVTLPLQNEVAGLRALGIDWVVARNTGGGASAQVVDAARTAGIPVGMIRRPAQPATLRFNTVTEVVAWLRRRLLELE